MRTFPPPSHPAAFWSGPLNFLEAMGPVLLLCIGSSLGVTFAYYYLVYPYRQRQKKAEWLAANRSALRKHLILLYALGAIHKKLPACSNCGERDPEFWNHAKDLLVFRCRHCQFNHTLSPFQYPEVLLVLENLPGLFIVLNQLKREPGDLLGNHLLELCEPMDWYCRKALLKTPVI